MEGATVNDKLVDAFGFSGWQYLHIGLGLPWKKPSDALAFPKLMCKRFFLTKSVEYMTQSAAEEGKAPLKKALNRVSLTFLGIGFMLGAGIFVSPGYIAQQLTGPALFISYLVAAFSAFLSSFCYAEFTVDMPLAGAAYNYISNTLGEVIAWITVSNLILEYILSNAAAVRGFAPYLALLCNQDSSYFLINWNIGPGYILDFWAFGVTIVVTILLQFGISESANVNSVITIIHLFLMAFIIIAGFVMGKKENFTPFIRQGSSWHGIFNGAAISFFSYIGFDAVATTAEEQIDPARDMPTAIIGAVGTVTVIYTLMSVVLSLMVPNDMINQNATYASAFEYVGLDWAKYVVAAGALMGITTTTLIGVLGASRILAGCTRERMLPPFISWVNSRQVPYVSTWIIGISSAVIALLTPFADLANMISIGTFIVFWVVAIALLFKRSYLPNVTSRRKFYILLVNLFAVIGFSLGFTLVWVLPNYQESDYQDAYVEGADYAKQKPLLIAMGVLFVASCFSFKYTVAVEYTPAKYVAPLFPFIPCVSIFVNLFLLGQLDQKSYLRFGWWTVAAMGVYYSYSMIAGEVKDLKYEARDMLPTVHVLPAHDSLALQDVKDSREGVDGDAASKDTSN
ncbi:MAG: hypothetical protein WDW36_007304 [Sanguina aurantia]